MVNQKQCKFTISDNNCFLWRSVIIIWSSCWYPYWAWWASKLWLYLVCRCSAWLDLRCACPSLCLAANTQQRFPHLHIPIGHYSVLPSNHWKGHLDLLCAAEVLGWQGDKSQLVLCCVNHFDCPPILKLEVQAIKRGPSFHVSSTCTAQVAMVSSFATLWLEHLVHIL